MRTTLIDDGPLLVNETAKRFSCIHTLAVIQDLEALSVMYGFRPVRSFVDDHSGVIVFNADKLFCLCCGSSISIGQHSFTPFQCSVCSAGICAGDVTAETFFSKHNKIDRLLRAVLS